MMKENGDRLKRIVSAICAALFVVATALGIPISESLLNVGQPQQQKSGGGLGVSGECEEEIENIHIYGDISEQCKKELDKLNRRLHHIENLLKQGESKD